MVKDFSSHCSPHNLGSSNHTALSNAQYRGSYTPRLLAARKAPRKLCTEKVKFISGLPQLDIIYNVYYKVLHVHKASRTLVCLLMNETNRCTIIFQLFISGNNSSTCFGQFFSAHQQELITRTTALVQFMQFGGRLL